MKLILGIIAFLIICQSCNPICLDKNYERSHLINVPFQFTPHKGIYNVGDTLNLSLTMKEYFSLTTNESLPIIENLVTYMGFAFYDSSAYMSPPVQYLGVDSFDFVLDSQDRIIHFSSGGSGVAFDANFDKENKSLNYMAKIIPRHSGFYILGISWDLLHQPHANYIEGCGEEMYGLSISINDHLEDGRNVSMIQNDTALIRQTLDGFLSRKSFEEVLADKRLYYFYVEE